MNRQHFALNILHIHWNRENSHRWKKNYYVKCINDKKVYLALHVSHVESKNCTKIKRRLHKNLTRETFFRNKWASPNKTHQISNIPKKGLLLCICSLCKVPIHKKIFWFKSMHFESYLVQSQISQQIAIYFGN